MIPPVFPSESTSPGEARVFTWLRNDPATADWTVLHAYDLPQRTSGQRHEADFVVLIPDVGIVCLEVKGHLSASVDEQGRWRLGADPFPSKNPVRQVLDTCYALKRQLNPGPGQGARVAPLLVFTDAAVPQISELDERCQLSPATGPVAPRLAGRVLACARGESGHPLAVGDLERVRDWLRPQFEVLASPLERRRDLQADLKRATDDQLRILDAVDANPRVLLDGPPGSGKTVLALEAARRAAAEGRTARMLCFNALLGRELEAQAAGVFPAGGLHRFLVQRLHVTPPAQAPSTWWSDLMHRAAEELEPTDQVDFLVVDEAQDLINPDAVPVLNRLVKGGLDQGTWLLAGDLCNQALQSEVDLHLLPSSGVTKARLADNCRNLPRHGQWIEQVIARPGLFRGYLRTAVAKPAQVLFHPGEADQLLRRTILQLREIYPPSDIVVLCPDQVGMRRLMDRLGLRPVAISRQEVSVATYRTFKGLEAPAIVVVASLTDQPDELLTAATRATEELIVILPETDTTELLARIEAG